MTQTFRRELTQAIKKGVDAWLASSQGFLGEEMTVDAAGLIADDILKISGIANSPTARKFRDPYWDLLHGEEPDENAVDAAKLYTSIAERLEKGLLRNEFPQTNESQKVYRWIAEREKAGEKLDEWIKWAMDGNRANYSYVYHQNPNHIKRDWPQAFARSSSPKSGRRLERLNNE
jgi:hypothetical protein